MHPKVATMLSKGLTSREDVSLSEGLYSIENTKHRLKIQIPLQDEELALSLFNSMSAVGKRRFMHKSVFAYQIEVTL